MDVPCHVFIWSLLIWKPPLSPFYKSLHRGGSNHLKFNKQTGVGFWLWRMMEACVIFGSDQVMNTVRSLSQAPVGTLETIVWSSLHIYAATAKGKHRRRADNGGFSGKLLQTGTSGRSPVYWCFCALCESTMSVIWKVNSANSKLLR